MEDDRIGTGGNVSNVAISFPEPPEKPLQVQSSADDEDQEEELVTPKEVGESDDPIINLQRGLDTDVSDFKGERSRMEQTIDLVSSEADSASAEADATKKVLEDQQNDLEERVRYLEAQLSDLKMVNESEVADFLKKEGELRLVIEELNVKLKKEGELRLVIEELNVKAEETKVALMKKEEEIDTLKKELKVWKEEVEAEKVKRSYSDAMEHVVVISLEEKLLIMRDKIEEVEAEREKIRLAMEKKENLIASLTEELRIKMEIEKKFALTMKNKEEQIVSLKKDLMLANENQEFESNKLKEELTQMKYEVSTLQERIKKILSENGDGGFLQNRHRMEQKKVEDGLKFSWLTTAAITASTGTAAATITALFLRHNKHG